MDLDELARKYGLVHESMGVQHHKLPPEQLRALVNEVLEEAAKHILSQADMGSERDEVERCAEQIRSLKLK